MSAAIETASRERLMKTLNHQQPDRIPIDFGGTAVTGVHVSVVAALRDHYGLAQWPDALGTVVETLCGNC